MPLPLSLSLSPSTLGSRDRTQAARLLSKGFYLLAIWLDISTPHFRAPQQSSFAYHSQGPRKRNGGKEEEKAD